MKTLTNYIKEGLLDFPDNIDGPFVGLPLLGEVYKCSRVVFSNIGDFAKDFSPKNIKNYKLNDLIKDSTLYVQGSGEIKPSNRNYKKAHSFANFILNCGFVEEFKNSLATRHKMPDNVGDIISEMASIYPKHGRRINAIANKYFGHDVFLLFTGGSWAVEFYFERN